MTALQSSKSLMMVVSVISRINDDGETSWAASVAMTDSLNPESRRLLAETLTEMVRSRPAARHAAHCRTAWSRTSAVSDCIRPASSASGRKSSGGIIPTRGCGQRTNASIADIFPVIRSIWGW
jgi:hypothetical protein